MRPDPYRERARELCLDAGIEPDLVDIANMHTGALTVEGFDDSATDAGSAGSHQYPQIFSDVHGLSFSLGCKASLLL